MDRKSDRGEAIVNLTRLTVLPEHRKEFCQTISSLIGPVKKEKGCLTYRFYEEAGEENTFVLIEEWETPDAWNNHIKSNNFAILRGSLGLLCAQTPVDFKLLSNVTEAEAMTRDRIK